jgi:hypothetical protein
MNTDNAQVLSLKIKNGFSQWLCKDVAQARNFAGVFYKQETGRGHVCLHQAISEVFLYP